MQDLNKIWSSCVETLEKNKIVDDKIILDSLFKPATLEEIEDNQVIITTELKWNIDAILEKRAEIESILSNSFSKPIKIKVLEVEEYKKSKQKRVPKIDSHLHPDMTFANFIVGNSNRMAQNAALLVSTKPGMNFNPLFLYSHPGLGKTHLLNAIGNKAKETNPNLLVRYITSKDFVDEIINSIKTNTTDEIYSYYRNLDILLIDDIQFLFNKEKSSEIFFHIFNELINNNKQIVLTSDRNPDQLNEMEERLVTRFKWGLTVNITPPDFETRVAILTNKIMDYDYHFPPETIEYLAGQFDSNVRDLEGALKDISLVANVRQLDTITVEVAAEAIRARKMDGPKLTLIPIEDIQTEVGKFYNVTVKEIKATKRTQNIVLARQVAMYLAREMTDNSLPKIGKEFGGRDHSTVLHAYNKIKNMIAQDDSLRIEIDTIKNKIK